MRLCIPTTSEAGLHGCISSHFGRAPFYTLVESELGGVSVIPNHNARHDHGQCALPDGIVGSQVDAVICRGIGRNALTRLRARGIQVYVTAVESVHDSVRAFQSGQLVAMSDDEVCSGGHDAH